MGRWGSKVLNFLVKIHILLLLIVFLSLCATGKVIAILVVLPTASAVVVWERLKNPAIRIHECKFPLQRKVTHHVIYNYSIHNQKYSVGLRKAALSSSRSGVRHFLSDTF